MEKTERTLWPTQSFHKSINTLWDTVWRLKEIPLPNWKLSFNPWVHSPLLILKGLYTISDRKKSNPFSTYPSIIILMNAGTDSALEFSVSRISCQHFKRSLCIWVIHVKNPSIIFCSEKMNPIKIHLFEKIKCQHLEIKYPLLSKIAKILCFNLF